MTISTIVYDIGQVLIAWDANRVWSRLMSADEVETFLAESDFARINHEVDAGLSVAEAAARIRAHSPAHADAFQHYFDNFDDSLAGLVPGSHDLVSELDAAGYRLLGLSNWSRETFHHALAAAPALGLLEEIMVSGEVGLAKPDPAIFDLLISTFGLVPAATVFIDDSPPNIDAAHAAGLHALLFTDVPTLRTQLVGLGVNLAPVG